MSNCYGFTLYAEGANTAIDELVDRLDPQGALRSANYDDAIHVVDLEPRTEGTRLVAISGTNNCLYPTLALDLKELSQELGIEIEVFDDDMDEGSETHYHYTPDGKTCVEESIQHVRNQWRDDPEFCQEEYHCATFKEYAAAEGFPAPDDEEAFFLDDYRFPEPFFKQEVGAA